MKSMRNAELLGETEIRKNDVASAAEQNILRLQVTRCRAQRMSTKLTTSTTTNR